MNIFNPQNKIIEIVNHDINLLPVINRFGIKIGFGDLNVKQVSINQKIDENFFLLILNVYHNENYFPEQQFVNFKFSDIINYLIKTHQYYNSYVIPEIERLFNVLLNNEKSNKDIFLLLEKIFTNFKKELQKHTDYEENIIFPKIIELSETDNLKITIPELNFINIHSQLDDIIIDIKNILFKYLPTIEDIHNCNAFAIAIFRFEKDLKDHARIEDRILYPKVKQFLNYTTKQSE
jgi:regulator of cell morphogenesis and NO signaling